MINEKLCTCGHYEKDHSLDKRMCHHTKWVTERKRNSQGKQTKVKCVYVCNCRGFKELEENKE